MASQVYALGESLDWLEAAAGRGDDGEHSYPGG